MFPDGPDSPDNVSPLVDGSTPQPSSVPDITTSEFGSVVLESPVPVLVDFWAPWCGPCKQLAPVLERLVAETSGSVRLVKMNIDEHPEVAGQLKIQSIPAVVAFFGGKPVDAFVGVKQPNEIQAFIQKISSLSPGGSEDDALGEALSRASELLSSKDYSGSAQIYASILEHDSGNPDALSGLGHCYLGLGETDKAVALADQISDEHREHESVVAFLKAVDLSRRADELGDPETLGAAVSSNPNDYSARFDYAIALNAAGHRLEAGEQLLEIVRRDRGWNDEAARKQLVDFFETWGGSDSATIETRRALSSILFS